MLGFLSGLDHLHLIALELMFNVCALHLTFPLLSDLFEVLLLVILQSFGQFTKILPQGLILKRQVIEFLFVLFDVGNQSFIATEQIEFCLNTVVLFIQEIDLVV